MSDHAVMMNAPSAGPFDAISTPDVDVELQQFAVELGRFSRAPWMPEVRRLSQTSNWHSVCMIAFQWGLIALACWAAVASGHWLVYVLAAFVIASRQQALGILVHDASHYLLFSNHAVNDVVADLFLAFPVGLSTTLYRSTHLLHHRHANSPQDPDVLIAGNDPDWRWPKTRWGCLRLLLMSLFALNLQRAAGVYMRWNPGSNLFRPLSPAFPLRARLLWFGSTIVVFGLVAWFNVWIPALLLWVLPSITILNVISRIRATAEHVLTPSTHELNSTRTVIPAWWERWLIAPLGINHHLEHHLFPSVPGYKLDELHRQLMRDEEFRQLAHITPTYCGLRHGLLGELLTPRVDESAAN